MSNISLFKLQTSNFKLLKSNFLSFSINQICFTPKTPINVQTLNIWIICFKDFFKLFRKQNLCTSSGCPTLSLHRLWSKRHFFLNKICAVFQLKHLISKMPRFSNVINYFFILKIDGDIEKFVKISIYLINQNCLIIP